MNNYAFKSPCCKVRAFLEGNGVIQKNNCFLSSPIRHSALWRPLNMHLKVPRMLLCCFGRLLHQFSSLAFFSFLLGGIRGLMYQYRCFARIFPSFEYSLMHRPLLKQHRNCHCSQSSSFLLLFFQWHLKYLIIIVVEIA